MTLLLHIAVAWAIVPNEDFAHGFLSSFNIFYARMRTGMHRRVARAAPTARFFEYKMNELCIAYLQKSAGREWMARYVSFCSSRRVRACVRTHAIARDREKAG